MPSITFPHWSTPLDTTRQHLMPCPDPSPSNPKRASHPFSAHWNSPCSPMQLLFESMLVLSAAGGFFYSIGPAGLFCVIPSELHWSGSTMCVRRKGGGLSRISSFCSPHFITHELPARTSDAWGWGGLDWERSIDMATAEKLKCHSFLDFRPPAFSPSSTPRQESQSLRPST